MRSWLGCGMVLTGALVATGLGGAGVSAAEDKAAAGKQTARHFEKEVTMRVKLDYLLYLPQGYDEGEKKWPLLLFLHGAGETAGPRQGIEAVKKHGPPKLIEQGKELPFIVVSPQAPRRGWDPTTLNALLDDIEKEYRVDRDRIYVTGLSMGGFGTWALAASSPKRFAAIAPICGGGNLTEARKIKDVPAWVFHGEKDPTVSVRLSREMVKALKDAGAREVKLTIYPDAQHDSWTETYNNPELYRWLLSHKRGGKE